MADNACEALGEKIVSEAKAEATRILEEAQKYYDEVVSEAERSAEEYLSAERKATEAAAESVRSRRATLAAIDGKKAVLSAKQELVGTVYLRAVNKLKAMPKEEYLSFVLGLIEKHAEKGETVVISSDAPFSAEDVAKSDVVVRLALKVRAEEIGGGIVIEGEKFDKDLSFASLVAAIREKTEAEVAERLFSASGD